MQNESRYNKIMKYFSEKNCAGMLKSHVTRFKKKKTAKNYKFYVNIYTLQKVIKVPQLCFDEINKLRVYSIRRPSSAHQILELWIPPHDAGGILSCQSLSGFISLQSCHISMSVPADWDKHASGVNKCQEGLEIEAERRSGGHVQLQSELNQEFSPLNKRFSFINYTHNGRIS